MTVGDFQGYVHFLDRDDGAFAVRIATDGSQIKARPLRVGQISWCRRAKAGCTPSRSARCNSAAGGFSAARAGARTALSA